MCGAIGLVVLMSENNNCLNAVGLIEMSSIGIDQTRVIGCRCRVLNFFFLEGYDVSVVFRPLPEYNRSRLLINVQRLPRAKTRSGDIDQQDSGDLATAEITMDLNPRTCLHNSNTPYLYSCCAIHDRRTIDMIR